MTQVANVTDTAMLAPPTVDVPDPDNSPVRKLKPEDLNMVGAKLSSTFQLYQADRFIAEQRWLRNQRQYLGLYDPEIETNLSPTRSKAYPGVTRAKVISVLSRLMNLMFQGEERNWTLKATPSADLTTKDVQIAIRNLQAGNQPGQPPQPLTEDAVWDAVKKLADQRADQLMTLIDDQLQEIGGDQSQDYVALNRAVIRSGIIYGLGVMRGPMAVEASKTSIKIDPMSQQPSVETQKIYKPRFEFLPVWDFYPDMSAKNLADMDGYFIRKIMSRSQLLALADRSDFMDEQIISYLERKPNGNYKPLQFEQELRQLGVKVNVNEQKPETNKYEVLAWHGTLSGNYLFMCGVDVPEDKMAQEIDAEVWMVDGNIIKATINPWRQLDVDVKTIHFFLFDEDDTSPVGQGLPQTMRDSQMAVSAMTRMYLDNASVTCGPQLELNTDLLRMDQDLYSTTAYKIWYRTGVGQDAQFPAVRNVEINAHLEDLKGGIDLFMKFADMETFVGPATGGDMAQSPSEPMRTAAGASMLRGDAALPFKDIVRNFDKLTQSVIESLICFNRKLNPGEPGAADYNVIARGATSLVAKEVRGMQVDQLAGTLTPEEKAHVDMRKLVSARMATRDLLDMLKPQDQVDREQAQQAQTAQAQQDLADAIQRATERKLLSEGFKNITQGNKNSATAEATTVDNALSLLEQGVTHGAADNRVQGPAPGGPDQAVAGIGGLGGGSALPGAAGDQAGPGQGQFGAGLSGPVPAAAG